MPVVWNAETEAKLLAGIFKVCDLKITGAQTKELAELIGKDCTPKAITHRLAKFRKEAGNFSSGGKTGAATPDGIDDDEAATPAAGKKGTGKKTPAKKTPGSSKKRKVAEVEHKDDEESEEGVKTGKAVGVKAEEVDEEATMQLLDRR